MKIAAVQLTPFQGDVVSNLKLHYQFIQEAAQSGVQLIVFPEMSLTGYLREEAKELAFLFDDIRLGHLRELAVLHNMVVVVGAPITIDNALVIGSFVILPDNSIAVYAKHFLHEGEEPFFIPFFDFDPVIKLGDEQVCFGICADLEHPEHLQKAQEMGCSLYVLSIFYSPGSITKAQEKLGHYAKKHALKILMSNYCGRSGEGEAGGGSAFWNNFGVMKAKLNGNQAGLLVMDV